MKCLIFLLFWFPSCYSYCTGRLRDCHIAGIWRLRSSGSFLPKFKVDDFSKRPLKEFTVYPPPEKKENPVKDDDTDDIMLLLREDGNFVQYGNADESSKKINVGTQVIEGTSYLGTMKGSWALVDGCLILAADRPDDTKNIRSESKKHDTILSGQIIATSGKGLVDNPALIRQSDDNNAFEEDGNDNKNMKDLGKSKQTKKEDVHLSVSGEISIGKFFYPQTHPSFFEMPMVGGTLTGSFELQQILGTLNTQTDSDEDQLVEKFRKEDLMNKRYFLTSYPLRVSTKRKKKQRWSVKYNQFVDDKPQSKAEKETEEQEKNAPMKIKSFEVELFANNTFSTIIGLGETVLRGKWSIIGEQRDHLWMSVWRFGFGRGMAGATFSEGTHLSNQDDVSYWGEILEVDAAAEEDCIMDDPFEWKGTKIEVNGAVMLGVGLEPCSIARFTMIEKTEVDSSDDEDDDDDDDEDDEDDEDDDVLDSLPYDVGSFE